MSEDPFYSVKQEVELSLKALNQLYEKWQRSQDGTKGKSALAAPSSDNDESRWITDELKESFLSIEEDLKDLDETVKIVESNPARFRLDTAEVASRKEFISKTRKSIREMQSTVASRTAKQGLSRSASGASGGFPQNQWQSSPLTSNNRQTKEKSDRDALLSNPKVKVDSYGRTEEEHRMSNQKFIEREQGLQQQIIRQQDAQLDEVLDTVGNLKEVAVVMGKELDDQTRLLEEVESHVDTTKGKLDMGMKRLREFINANADKKQQWTICGLITALVILLILVLLL
ncbi:Syntaxin-6 [Phlyctochytrium bullatum]|nr:Syntaxin-6 [Phlyctochytrium bullatum]